MSHYYLHRGKVIKQTKKPHSCYCCGKMFPAGSSATYIVHYGDSGFQYGYFFHKEIFP